MRKTTIAGRIAAVGLAVSVAALATTASAGSAATTKDGVGTGIVSTSVIDAALGDLLGVSLLQNLASSTTDPKVGPAGATSVLRQVQLTGVLPLLNRSVGESRVSAPQGPTDVTTSLLDLNSLGLGAVIKGTIQPIVLKALSVPNSATASSAKITDLGLLGGLANLGVLNATDMTGSGVAAAEAGRNMTLDALSVLDLGKLLRGLGLDILNLPLSVVSGLLTSLGIPIDLKGATNLQGLVQSLLGTITTLTDTVQTTVTTPLLNTITGLGLPLPLRPVLDSVITTALATAKTTLTNLINMVVGLLDSATLLKLNALDINTVAKATDAVSSSTATATGKLGGLQIGGVTLPGIDLAAATAVVNNLLAQVQSLLGGILAPLGLGNLLSLRLFDRQTGVTETDGVVKAVSSITGLVLKLAPPLPSSLAPLNRPTDGLGSLIPAPTTAASGSVAAASIGTAMPAAAPNPLEGLLGITSILTKGFELRIGTVQSQSFHAVPASPAVPGSPASPNPANPTIPAGTTLTRLPRTGGEQTTLALMAMGLGAAALGARRLRRRLRA